VLQAALPVDSDGATSAYHSPAAAIAAAETHRLEALAAADEADVTGDAAEAVDASTEPDATVETEPGVTVEAESASEPESESVSVSEPEEIAS
jgi:hypothetical protein